MAQSVKRKIKRGHIRILWNSTMNKMDFFRKASDGLFILCGPSGQFIAQGPGHHEKTLNKWEMN